MSHCGWRLGGRGGTVRYIIIIILKHLNSQHTHLTITWGEKIQVP
jgi:hypothetical protein